MSVTSNLVSAPHPWLERLNIEPERAVDTLLRGVAYLPGLQRASQSEALMALMGDLAPEAPEWDLLDRALQQWLQVRRAKTEEILARPGGVERFVRETGEAFRATWRLNPDGRCNLPHSRAWMHTELFDLLRWADNFSLDAKFDLGRTVLIAASHMQDGNEFRFLWLRICDEAAAPRLRQRLDAALLGLASIPVGKAGGPSHDLIVGLARWASLLPRSEHFKGEVVREWRSLKAAFPRQPSFWRDSWQAILDDERIASHPFTDWLKESDPALQGPSKAAPSRRPPKLPRDIKGTIQTFEVEYHKQGLTQQLWGKIAALLDQVESYANATGESYYLVTSCTNIARMILDCAPGQALTLTRRALLWAPANGHAWSIRATALDRLGRPDLAEAVLWEATRRIPSNVVFPVELAQKWVERGGLAEAEALLRKSAILNPNDAAAHVELARVIWLSNRAEEALILLRAIEMNNKDPVISYTLCMLLVAEGLTTEATKVLEQYICVANKNSSISTLRHLITTGAAGQKEVQEHLRKTRHRGDSQQNVIWEAEVAERALAAEQVEFPRLERISRVAKADLLFRLGAQHKEDALQLVDTALEDSGDAYAHVVKGLAVPEYRMEMQGRIHRFTGSLPVRLAFSPENTDGDHWHELLRQFPERQYLTYLVQLARGQADDTAKAALMAWSSEPSRWDNSWDIYLKQTLYHYLEGNQIHVELATLVHDALTQAVDVGFDATPLVA
ncbi:hypothetical protein HBO02_22610 [Pseudomonas proteolytica]|uniref:hypothetical protein n=1 Tax=Pseudomonas proteolytica TaxID=219574 RepID=UPI00147430B5|nr:hypothetical protein [Pseudomonas proteolytica]NMZ25216.1 hypothetical protein [Pseudomonas proteolytica]